MFLLTPAAQVHLIQKVARALVPAGQLLFSAPRQATEWLDDLTRRTSVSLGADSYRATLEAAGLVLVDETTDEGDNHYYLAHKLRSVAPAGVSPPR
jgi:hypothetical protein